MKERSCNATFVESRGGEGTLTRSSQQLAFDHSDGEGGEHRRGGAVGEECVTEVRNCPPPLQAIHFSAPREIHSTALDVSDLVDRLSHVHVSSKSGQPSLHFQRAGTAPTEDIEKLGLAGTHGHGEDNISVEEIVEHTETTHDETLSVAGKDRGEAYDRQEEDESLEDASVMTGSFGNGGGIQHLTVSQQWHGQKGHRHQSGQSHAEGGGDDGSGCASGFSLDAMVGHSSCESSVTWYEGSHIEEITVDDDGDKSVGTDASHEDVLLRSSSGDYEEMGGSNVEVVVYEDDETMFEWTSTESFFGEDDDDDDHDVDLVTTDIILEQSLSPSSSSASSCTSPLSSPPPPPPQAASSPLIGGD